MVLHVLEVFKNWERKQSFKREVMYLEKVRWRLTFIMEGSEIESKRKQRLGLSFVLVFLVIQ